MGEKLKALFRSYLFDGILLIILGIMLLLWPESALVALCTIIGCTLIVLSLFKFISFFSDVSGLRSGGVLFVGLLQLVAGIALVVNPGFFIAWFQIIVGIMLFYGAVLLFVNAWDLRDAKGSEFAATIIFAVLMLILAVIIIINPISFAAFIVSLEGISLIIEGLSMVIFLHRVKRVAKKVEKAAEDDENIIDAEEVE